MIVAIDGPAGSGKSTVAKAIAKRCGLTLLDTGAMYRSCALLAVQAGLDVYDPANVDAIVDIARAAVIRFEQREEGQGVFANGQPAAAVAQPSAPAPDPVLMELSNAATAPARLQEIAAMVPTHPEYKAGLLAHPNLYPALRTWLEQL